MCKKDGRKAVQNFSHIGQHVLSLSSKNLRGGCTPPPVPARVKVAKPRSEVGLPLWVPPSSCRPRISMMQTNLWKHVTSDEDWRCLQHGCVMPAAWRSAVNAPETSNTVYTIRSSGMQETRQKPDMLALRFGRRSLLDYDGHRRP